MNLAIVSSLSSFKPTLIWLLKFSNAFLHPEILLAKSGNLKIELLLI